MLSPSTVALRVFAELPHPMQRKLGRGPAWSDGDLPVLPEANRSSKNLLIAPANSAGQAKLWSMAASEIPGWTGYNLTYRRGPSFAHATDSIGLEAAVVYSPKWARKLRRLITEDFSAVIYESLLPLLGSLHFQDATREIRYLKKAGVKTAVLWHGSDIRDPNVHKSITQGSVFHEAPDATVRGLGESTKRNAAALKHLGVPVFVSTPDLLRYQPSATWLPVVVSDSFLEGELGLQASTRPVVLHLPSQGYLKGTEAISREMRRLDREGVIQYLQPERVPHFEVRALLERADIVVDQIGMNLYGVAAIEAMALGKTVVGQVGDFIRDVVKTRTGWEVPVQEADAVTLGPVVQDLATNVSFRTSLAASGRQFVKDVHSPKQAAQAMTPFLEG